MGTANLAYTFIQPLSAVPKALHLEQVLRIKV